MLSLAFFAPVLLTSPLPRLFAALPRQVEYVLDFSSCCKYPCPEKIIQNTSAKFPIPNPYVSLPPQGTIEKFLLLLFSFLFSLPPPSSNGGPFLIRPNMNDRNPPLPSSSLFRISHCVSLPPHPFHPSIDFPGLCPFPVRIYKVPAVWWRRRMDWGDICILRGHDRSTHTDRPSHEMCRERKKSSKSCTYGRFARTETLKAFDRLIRSFENN